jgi:hypothetical protein
VQKQLRLTATELAKLENTIYGALMTISNSRSMRSVEETEQIQDKEYVLTLTEVVQPEVVKEIKGKKKVEVHE